VFELFL